MKLQKQLTHAAVPRVTVRLEIKIFLGLHKI